VKLEFHPVAEIFPLMADAELEALAADIGENGLREPVWLHSDGRLIDGRNRYLACQKAGVTPATREWDGDEGQLVSFIVSLNLHRRHLNESQRAVVAAKIANRRREDTLIPGGLHSPKLDRHKSLSSISAGEAAHLLNVSEKSVFNAKTVLREGTAEEREAVERGEVAVTTVAKQIRAKMSPERRAKKRTQSLSDTGKNPERIQRLQINGEIWGRVRDALTHLTSLPDPADVATIARLNDKTGLVAARLPQSLTWLKEFSNVWSSSDAA